MNIFDIFTHLYHFKKHMKYNKNTRQHKSLFFLSNLNKASMEVVSCYVHFKQSHLLGWGRIQKDSMFSRFAVKLEKKKEVFVLLMSSYNFQVFVINYSQLKHDDMFWKEKKLSNISIFHAEINVWQHVLNKVFTQSFFFKGNDNCGAETSVLQLCGMDSHCVLVY